MTSKVGLGTYSLIWPRIAIFVRPFTSTYWIALRYASGRWRVNASIGSQRWLSASQTSSESSRIVLLLRRLSEW